MNLQQLITELHERNKQSFEPVFALLDKGDEYIRNSAYDNGLSSRYLTEKKLDNVTTDTAHAVALAVIGEIEKYLDRNGVLYADDYDNFLPTLKIDHLPTLEKALQDNK